MSATTNVYAMLNRERKVVALAEFLDSVNLSDPDVVALALDHERDQVATLAGVKKPSVKTWGQLVQFLRERQKRRAADAFGATVRFGSHYGASTGRTDYTASQQRRVVPLSRMV